MIEEAVTRWRVLCDTIPALLSAIGEEDLCAKPYADKWSKKEVIGHLIDSATNNHQRFVRAQFENIPAIRYDQNNWNQYSYHAKVSGKLLIELWRAYNKQLVELVANIPADKLLCEVNTGSENIVTIAFLVNDYVAHLEHHLKSLLSK